VGWAIELRKLRTGCRPCAVCGKATLTSSVTSRAAARPGVVEDPSTSRNNRHENRETSLVSATADRSGKANNHKPDMYAREESDCAIVPMKLPNKEAQASAEAVEGRVWTKENDAELDTSPTQSGERVSHGLGGVRQVAICDLTPLIQGRSRMR
jgi:hypothetical protein